MSYQTILYREDGPVGWLTLNRPHDGNMFTPAMCHEIRDCINDIRRETRTRVLVITGAGERTGSRHHLEARLGIPGRADRTPRTYRSRPSP